MASNVFPLDRYPADTPLPDYSHSNEMERIIAYCAEEVRRQGDTAWHVWRMYDAWLFALEEEGKNYRGTADDVATPLTKALIEELGRMVDEINEMGFRKTAIFISDGYTSVEKAPALDIDWRMNKLISNQWSMTSIDFYAEFEEIHPFSDGNGRVGKILYNWHRGSLMDPVWPKDLYGGISNP
jgi:hypothetical protein